jgi:type III restriction enzyme
MADEITGAGPTAPNEVDEPIINSPFAEPALHWQIEKGQPPVKVPGRRTASYYYRVPESAARGRKAKAQRSLLGETNIGEREDLDLVNWLRQRIKDLRAAGWPGTSPVTRELLRLWWASSDQRKQRLFFAQLEAAETMIFLVEGADADKKGMPPIPRDEPSVEAKAAGLRAFTRYACKMATGTGKSTVMGMLAA